MDRLRTLMARARGGRLALVRSIECERNALVEPGRERDCGPRGPRLDRSCQIRIWRPRLHGPQPIRARARWHARVGRPGSLWLAPSPHLRTRMGRLDVDSALAHGPRGMG